MKPSPYKYFILAGFLGLMMIQPQSAHAETVVVQIIKSSFVPAVVKIKKGDTVRWINTENLMHTVTSGKAPNADGLFNGPNVPSKFETVINQTGFIDYFCALHHAIMRGVIIVEDKPAEKP